MKYFIGIDPGLNGALAWIDGSGNIQEIIVMPTIKIGKKSKLDLKAIEAWFRKIMDDDLVKMVALEEQRPMHKQGVTSTFTIGYGYGQLEGIISALQLPYRVIRAVDWQKIMFKGLPKGNTKDKSRMIAQQLQPKFDFKKSDRCTILHDGRTDAYLISEHIRRETK